MHKLTHDDIYRILAGALTISPKDFNPNTPLMSGYRFDSLSVFEIPLLIEEHYGVVVELPTNTFDVIHTGKDLADYVVAAQNDN